MVREPDKHQNQIRGPIDLVLVQQLLDSLDVPVQAGQLQRYADQSGSTQSSSCEWLRELFVAAEVSDLQPVLLPWQRFDPRRLPALIHHQQKWYFANTALDAMNITLTDKAGVQSSASAAELDDAEVLWISRPPSRAFDGRQAFSANGPANETGQGSSNLAAKLVWKELFRERGWLWQLMVSTCVVNLIGVSTSLFAMQVYDRVVPTMAYATLTALVAGMAVVVLLDWVLKLIRARILDSLACAVDQRTSQHLFEHLLHLQLDAQPHRLGTLAAQVGSLDTVRQFFTANVVFALVDLPFALMFLAFIGIIGGSVAWVYVLLLPAALLLGVIAQRRLKNLFRGQLSRSNERQGLLVDSIRGAESIRASNAGWRFARQWQELTASINRFGIQHRAVSSLSTVTTSSLSIIAYVSAVIVGVWQIEAGLLTMGGLIACTILGGRIIAPVAQSVQHLVQYQQVSQALAMVHQVLALKPERRDDQQLLAPTAQPTTLALNSLRFAYPDSPIRQVSIDALTLSAGDRVLLAGSVGSGKSTLLKILAGLYRPSEGQVQLGQADLWETDPLLVSQQIGYLPQVVHLFRGTLRSNLNLSGTVSDDALLQISEQLGIDSIARSSPLGMDRVISEGGEGLSGGQRQLVALARVFLNQPRIWLLDEPMASLDRATEEQVWQALEASLRKDDMLVVSTHRPLLASRLVNRVLLLEQGRIVRDGSPDELMPRLARRGANPPAPKPGQADVV